MTGLAFDDAAQHAGPKNLSVLLHATLSEMCRALFKINEGGPSVEEGLCSFSVRPSQTTFVGHTGNQAGFRAPLFLNSGTGAVIIAACNTDSDLPTVARPAAFQRTPDAALGPSTACLKHQESRS